MIKDALKENGFFLNIAPTRLADTLCKKIAIGFVCAGVSLFAHSDIYISEVVEGSSNNKAIEIANNGASAVTLTGYQLASEFSGAWANHYNLDAITIPANDVWVIANSSADAALLALADATESGFLLRFNGNDALALLLSGAEHDVFGEFGFDSFNTDVTLRRCNHTLSTTYQTWQWESFTTDDWTNIGTFNAEVGTCVAPPDPNPPSSSTTATIMSLQGDGSHSPHVDVANGETTSEEVFLINGIVTAVQSTGLGSDLPEGFFLQDASGDGNANTSDAIFVSGDSSALLAPGSSTQAAISVGDELDVYGSVSESSDWTIFIPAQDQGFDLIYQQSTGNSAIAAQPLRTLETDATFDATLERYENMSVEFDATSDMAIARTFGFDFDSFRNNLIMSHGGVNFHPNQHFSPGSAESIARRTANEENRIIVESFSRASNGVVPWYPNFGSDNGQGTTDDYLRVGATISGLQGMITYSSDEYRFFTTNQITDQNITYTHLSDRTTAPDLPASGLRIATMNVLNFFTSPFGGADNPLDTNRGAEVEAEYMTQRAKIVAAVVALDADVIGLMEIENNGFDSNSAVFELMSLVNAEFTPDKQYVIARPAADKRIGTDAISSQLVYRRSRIGLDRLDVLQMPFQRVPDEFYPTQYEGSWDNFRPSSKFMRNAVTPVFTIDEPEDKKLIVSVNHFKSKGSTCWEDLQTTKVNDDGETVHILEDTDYQGNCEHFRVAAADYLGRLLDGYQGYRIIVGDLNSYANEDPVMVLTNRDNLAPGRTLKAGRNVIVGSDPITDNNGKTIKKSYGYINIARKKHENTISYSFNDEVGTLDHILITPDLESFVVDATDWNINSVESTLFQYESAFTGSLPKYEDPYRSSDHDPAIVVLNILPEAATVGAAVSLPNTPANMPSSNSLKEGESHRSVVNLTDFSVTEMNVGERINIVLSDKNTNNVVTTSQLGRIDLTSDQISRGWVEFTFQAVVEGSIVVEAFYNDEVITVKQATVQERDDSPKGGSFSFLFLGAFLMLFMRGYQKIIPASKMILLSLLSAVLLSGCNENDQKDKLELLLVINTDRFPEELSWSITNSKHEVIRSESGGQYEKDEEYKVSIGLDPGGYRFEIKDSGNDGLCCSYGNGSFQLFLEGDLILDDSGGFQEEIQHVFNTNAYSSDQYTSSLEAYYLAADLLDGYELKTALHNIIKTDSVERTFAELLDFYASSSLDTVFENDQTILDIYSENPSGTDPYNFTPVDDVCGTHENEGDCYDREHLMPSDWFDGDAPMESDVHHVFAADAKVMEERNDLPYGEVDKGSVAFTSQNGSRVGSGHLELGYSQPVFEPIDQFKGDIARAFFYMATRYEDVIEEDDWHGNSQETSAAFSEGSSDQVYQSWLIEMLLLWNELDPVSPEERARNEAAHTFQGNRNPFIDHPEFAEYIWGHEGFEPANYQIF